MKAASRQEAWEIVGSIFQCDYCHNTALSDRAGYPVYTSEETGAWISDLGSRIEVNMEDGRSINVWIEDEQQEASQEEQTAETTKDFAADFETETRKGNETVSVKMSARLTLGKDTRFSEITGFLADVKKMHAAAIKAIKAGNDFTMTINEATYRYFPNKDPYKVGRFETLSFDSWQSVPVWEQSEDGVYFRPDTKYTNENRDMFLTAKNLMEDLRYTLG